MNNLSKIIKPIISLFLLTIIVISCEKDQGNSALKNHKIDRDAIAKQIGLHSAGLDKAISSFKKSESLEKLARSNSDLTSPNNDLLLVESVYANAELSIQNFLTNNNLAEHSHTVNLYIGNPFKPEVSTISLQNIGFSFSKQFYLIGQDILNVEGVDLNSVREEVDLILSTDNFLALSEVEQTILVIGAETYIDSFNFWSTSSDWEDIISVKSRNDNDFSINKIGSTIMQSGNSKDKDGKDGDPNSTKSYAKADARGAIAGAIGGAVGGAVVGGVITGGVGAGPGALAGAIGGGVGGGVSASVGKALAQLFGKGYEMPYPNSVEKNAVILGVIVPISWDLIYSED